MRVVAPCPAPGKPHTPARSTEESRLKDAIDLSILRRVLVIKLRHHGDVLLTTPLFGVLKNHAPHLEIDALVYLDTAEMLTLHPAISQIHTIDRSWKRAGLPAQCRAEWRLLAALWERDYDLVIHLTQHHRGAWLTRLLDVRYSVAEMSHTKGRFWRNSFTHFFSFTGTRLRHRVELNLDALRRIGVHPGEEERQLALVAGAEAEASVEQMLEPHGLHGQDFIHLHPPSRWRFKCWPEEKMTALIERLQAAGHRIVLSAAPNAEEMAMVRRIAAPLAVPPLDLSGRLSLKQLAALAARAKLFVGVDSAPMHIAAAMGTPTVALFGPSGDQEWGPWRTPHCIVTSAHSCRPCGNDGCGGGKISDCLETISVEQTHTAIHALMRELTGDA